MVKTIFEGFVNGKKYTDEGEFNSAVQEAIAAGKPMNIKSGNKTVSEPEPLYPFFGCAVSPSILYLDSMGDEVYRKTLENLPEKYGKILEYYQGSDAATQNNVYYKINNIISTIGAYKYKIENDIKRTENEIQKLNNKLIKLNDNSKANEEILKAYNILETKMKEFNPGVKPIKNTSVRCNTVQDPGIQDLVDSITKMIDDINTWF